MIKLLMLNITEESVCKNLRDYNSNKDSNTYNRYLATLFEYL